METQVMAVVPSQRGKIFVRRTEGSRTLDRTFDKPAKVFEWKWFRRQQEDGKEIIVLGIMGGSGQELFVRFLQMGIPVHRVPIYRLQALVGFEPKSSAQERADALLSVWEKDSSLFYSLEDLDPTIVLIRELTRQRLNIQEFRKKATNQLHGALRRLVFILPEQSQELVRLLRQGLKELFRKPELREQIETEFGRLEREVQLTDLQQARLFAIRQFFSNPRFILGAKEDEIELERRILALLKEIPIWEWIKPGPDSVLPAIKGFGPSIGGSVISEIGDIRRFPSANDLRAYARFHVAKGGIFPRRVAGELSPWNPYLNRAVWLWSTDQIARYDHIWRKLYLWKKAKEMKKHPEAEPSEITDKRGRKRTIYNYTLKHLDMRAKRWVGSQLLNYLWELWWKMEKGEDPELYYRHSSWPAYFARIEQELETGLSEYLESEIPKRRRTEPKEEAEEDEELEEF